MSSRLLSLIPVLVTGIQQWRVCAVKDSSAAKDLSALDSCDIKGAKRSGHRNEGNIGGQARILASLFAVFLLILTPIQAFAVNPDEVLSDPALEARARTISMELRCMVCQNQSIDDSNADLAKDLRLLVRKRLVQGDSNQQVIDYLVSRYGEFVLLKPRLSERTWILWGAPIGLLVAGGLSLAVFARRRKPALAPLTSEEKSRLESILRD